VKSSSNSLQHFFLENTEKITKEEQIYQITKVLRYKTGNKIIGIYQSEKFLIRILFDETEKKIKEIYLEIISSLGKNLNENKKLDLVVLMPLLKTDKNELILQKATELGVNRFIPVKFERSVTKIPKTNNLNKRIRWEKIIKEAAEQSERSVLPILSPIIDFTESLEILQNLKSKIYLFLTREKNLPSLYELEKTRENLKNTRKKVTLVFGPEGGISEKELVGLKKIKSLKRVQLGSRILRAETAVICAISVLSEFENSN